MFIKFLKQKLLFPLEILKYVTFVKLRYTVNIVLPLFAKVGTTVYTSCWIHASFLKCVKS